MSFRNIIGITLFYVWQN